MAKLIKPLEQGNEVILLSLDKTEVAAVLAGLGMLMGNDTYDAAYKKEIGHSAVNVQEVLYTLSTSDMKG